MDRLNRRASSLAVGLKRGVQMKAPSLILPELLLVSLAVTACASAAAPIAASLRATEALPRIEASAPGDPTLLPAALPEATSPPEAAPTEAVVLGPGGQFATDPATVVLASGRPTLVKFFAFW